MSKFWKNNKGNAGILFAAAAVPLILAAGMGIDMVRANRTQTILQGAADAAAIAGAASGITDKAELQKIVEDYAIANGINNALDLIESIEPKSDSKTRTFSVTIKGKMDTSLMQLANISDMEISAFSEVTMGGAALELVLVLDTTGSMGSAGRMVALKDAADDLVQDMMKLEADGVDLKIGIVPFGEYVNVGMGNRNKAWIDVPPDSTTTQNECWNTYPDAKEIGNCRIESWTDYVDGIAIPRTGKICDWDYGKPVEMCGMQTRTYTWHGCVGSRDNPMDETTTDTGLRYTGLQNQYCGAPITVLTDDEGDLRDAIKDLTPVGATYIPAGLIWGWNMITSSAPLEEAKTLSDMQSLGGTKAIVLMTDGANTISATYPRHDGGNAATADAKTAAICDNIKKDGITVYTVSFMVDLESAQIVLENCASDKSKAFVADSDTELSKAFEQIGKSLAAMRLSK